MTTDLELSDLRRGYVNLLAEVLRRGERVRARGLSVLELTGVRLTFTNPLAPLLPVGVGRGVNVRLAAVEALQVIAGDSRPELLRAAAPTYDSVLVEPSDLDYGAYGPRLAYSLGDCLDLLRADPGTRQAVAAIWRPDDLEHAGDKPCTVFLQFLVRASDVDAAALELYVYMRSQDAWLGVPYDVFTFSQLQHTLARALRLPTGRYVHHATSLHLYERDVTRARFLVDHVDDGYLPGLHVDAELPLGVVAPSDLAVGHATGIEVASYLLDDADPGRPTTATTAERDANRWYARQLGRLRAGATS